MHLILRQRSTTAVPALPYHGSPTSLTFGCVYAQDMISKLGSQMQELMDASQQRQPGFSPTALSAAAAVEPAAVVPTQEADVAPHVGRDGSHTVSENSRGDGRQAQQTSDGLNRPASPLKDCGTL